MQIDTYFGIKGFVPTSFVDWPDKICSVIFLAGCTFRCPYCHNSSLALHPESLDDVSLESILSRLDSRKAWIDGVTVTGGEPTARRGLPELLYLFQKQGISVKLDTNGSNPSMLQWIIENDLVHAVYMDVKAPLDERCYSRAAGTRVNPDIIYRSIDILKRSSIEIVFRTTVIPGLVAEEELEEIRRTLGHVDTFLVQRFRNESTLDPSFTQLPEFNEDRFLSMQNRYEVRGSIRRRPEGLSEQLVDAAWGSPPVQGRPDCSTDVPSLSNSSPLRTEVMV